MNISSESHVGQLVAQNISAARVFEKYGIDFCCNGNKSLSEACAEMNIDLNEIENALRNLDDTKGSESPDFASWPLDLLADYIEKKHHRYVNENLMPLTKYLEKITAVHGSRHPELEEIKSLFEVTAREMSAHMKKEELILFPFIRKLLQLKIKGNSNNDPSSAGAIQNPVRKMMHDHDAEGERFRRIAQLSNSYTPPADGCNTYQVTYARLKEFEKDLHIHIHLENNILFPGAIKLEKDVFWQKQQ